MSRYKNKHFNLDIYFGKNLKIIIKYQNYFRKMNVKFTKRCLFLNI